MVCVCVNDFWFCFRASLVFYSIFLFPFFWFFLFLFFSFVNLVFAFISPIFSSLERINIGELNNFTTKIPFPLVLLEEWRVGERHGEIFLWPIILLVFPSGLLIFESTVVQRTIQTICRVIEPAFGENSLETLAGSCRK